uniref:Dynein axonemal intermediate chain 7 n=1 Tax=Castor canadensis TaxID=51338 RepID=A0A8C0ZSJ6_CASCN
MHERLVSWNKKGFHNCSLRRRDFKLQPFTCGFKSDSKKKKISKAERLRLLQEEEERRLREEEEARLKFEKEQQERLEIERIEREKWFQLEEKHLERRNQELEELYLLEGCFSEAEKLKRDTRSLSQWKHYTECDGSPDPSVTQEMNTFISLWKEEATETFEAVMEKSKLVLSLIEKLKLILLEAPPCDLESKNIIQYQRSILQLQELLHLKFNVATEILLRQASTLADLDSGNMEKVIQDENVTLYLWANLKKNPKYKSIRFSDTQIGFEIPRILATSDIALRLLHTRYDHVTPLCPVLIPAEEPVPPEPEVVPEVMGNPEEAVDQKDLVDQEESKEGEGEPGSTQEEEVKEEPRSAEELRVGTSVTGLISFPSQYKTVVICLEAFLIENATEKPYILDDTEVDLWQFTTLGGVYHLDVLELPPLCKPVKGWMIVELLKEGLQKFAYPPETTEDMEAENVFPPIEVSLKIHDNVVFFEDPMVVRWDDEGKRWRSNGIANVYYRPEERIVTFNLEAFGPVTLIQDTHINMPYQSWELRPLDVNRVLLTVTTVFTELQIQIKENLCMLASIKLKTQEHISALEGKWMAPIPFIIALKKAGLNVFPTGHSHFYVITNNKVPLVEMKAYRQMALLSSAFAFGWSKWNAVCNSTKVIFKVKEQLTEEPATPDWVLLMFSGDRAQSLKISEESEVFSESVKEETQFHSTLYHMVKEFASEEAMERTRGAACQFVDSVCYMLLSTRVLSYS